MPELFQKSGGHQPTQSKVYKPIQPSIAISKTVMAEKIGLWLSTQLALTNACSWHNQPQPHHNTSSEILSLSHSHQCLSPVTFYGLFSGHRRRRDESHRRQPNRPSKASSSRTRQQTKPWPSIRRLFILVEKLQEFNLSAIVQK